jgi:calmodulin-lysine N-methyltransferase
MEMNNKTKEKASSLRWKILRQALLSNPSPSNSGNFILTHISHSITLLFNLSCSQLFADDQSQTSIKRISRRTTHGFNLIPSHVINDENGSTNCNGSSIKDARVCYTLPIPNAPELFLRFVLYFPLFLVFTHLFTLCTEIVIRTQIF